MLGTFSGNVARSQSECFRPLTPIGIVRLPGEPLVRTLPRQLLPDLLCRMSRSLQCWSVVVLWAFLASGCSSSR